MDWKTRKFFKYAILVGPIFLALIAMLVGFAMTKLQKPHSNPTFTVQDKHRQCETNEDCVLIHTECDRCSLGTPVNKKYAKELQEKAEAYCERYEGPVCRAIKSDFFASFFENDAWAKIRVPRIYGARCENAHCAFFSED